MNHCCSRQCDESVCPLNEKWERLPLPEGDREIFMPEPLGG